MKPSLILHCGGTIGMQQTNGGLAVQKGALEQFCFTHFAQHAFDWQDLDPLIDSSQASIDDWQTLCNQVLSQQNNYQAIIILHGTDSLAYSAAALAVALLNKLTIPIIITAAQKSVFEDDSDGSANIAFALTQAEQNLEANVHIAFDHNLYQGLTSFKQHTEAFAAFNHRDHALKLCHPYQHQTFSDLAIQTEWCSPSHEPELADKTKLLIIMAYGSGNLNQASKTLIHQANQKGIAVILSSQVIQGGLAIERYDANHSSQPLHVFVANKISYESIIAICRYLASSSDKLEQALSHCFDAITLS